MIKPIVSQSPPVEVASVVRKLAELRRQAQRRRYSGPTPQLPSRYNILAVINDILSATYPLHFSEAMSPTTISTTTSPGRWKRHGLYWSTRSR